MTKVCFRRLSRRNVIFLSTAIVCTSTLPAFPKGGGGGGDTGIGSTAPRKAPSLKAVYTAEEFRNLSKREIATMSQYRERQTPNGKRIRIEGYDVNMVSWLVAMMDFDRPSTRSLMRDMSRLKGKAKRQARLQQEANKLDTRIKKLKASRERARGKGQSAAVNEASVRIEAAEETLEGVKIWHKHWDQGTK